MAVNLFDAAALGGNRDAVPGLLGAGARPDVIVVSASSGRSALYPAAYCGQEVAGICLVAAGADVNFEDPVDKWSLSRTKPFEGENAQLVEYLTVSGAN